MKGLFVKDIKTMMLTKASVFLVIVLIIICMFMGEEGMAMVMVPMATLMFAYLASGTLSYDEYDNGLAYLMTLPSTRKMYVIEKYLFSIVMTLVGCVISFIGCYMVMKDLKKSLFVCGLAVIAAVITQALNIPLVLKLGAEKARIFSIILLSGFGGLLGGTIADGLEDVISNSLVRKIISLGDVGIALSVTIIILFIEFVSMFMSIKIMEKKEF